MTEYPAIVSGAAQSSVGGNAAAYLHPSIVLSTTPTVLVRHQAEAKATDAPSAAAAAATPDPSAAPGTPQAKFTTYTVQPGDTVYSIAESFGIDANYIMWNNPEVRADPDYLLIGADVLIPSVNGLVYTVTLGDTLGDIAAYYNTDIQSITAYGPNALSSPDDVIEGMVLVLPGAVPPPPPPPPAPEPAPAAVSEPEPAYAPPPAYANAPPPAVAYTSSGYIWPFHGPISTYFSSYHRGIDIDGFGNYGATIVAAADGVVVLAASQSWGYGNHIILEHSDGSRTLYAHLSAIWVSQGQYVAQGEGIGALGSTGYSTGPHLHFEVHIGGPVDPLAYLP